VSSRELDAHLDQIDTRLDRLASSVESVLNVAHGNASAIDAAKTVLGRQLTTLAQAQEQTSDRLDHLHEAFVNFVEQDRLDKERLFAHTMLITVRAEIKAKFGQYEDVRRNVHGMLQAIDGGLAQDATMQLIAEMQSINAPGYWLASAQNALAAWIRDDRGAAERALLDASSCSRGKTALFFGLLNARYGRFNATDKWFREYLNAQNPERLSQEFTVVLDAAMLNLLGDSAYDRVRRQCHAWFEKLHMREGIVQQQVVQWQLEIARCCEPLGLVDAALRDGCQVLPKLSPDWPRVMKWYRDATAFGSMKDKLSTHLNLPQSDESAWRERIDATLRELHTIPEPEESALRREEADLQRIIEYEGDKAAAARAQAAEASVDEPQVDLLTFLTNVVLHPRRLDVSKETTQLALYLAAPWIRQACENITAESKTGSKVPIKIEIDGWSGRLGTEPVNALAEAFSGVVDSQTEKKKARERFAWPRFAAALVAAVSLAFMTFKLTRSGTFQLSAVTVSGCLAAVSLLAAVMVQRRIPKRERRAEERGNQRKRVGLATLHTAKADHEKLITAWEKRIQEADHLKDFVNSVPFPELRRGTRDQWPPTEKSEASIGAETFAPSRAFSRQQPPFVAQREWSLEPVRHRR
jgi:hypothetical protein